jgi:hypothetical protein
VTPLYGAFRNIILQDLRKSERLKSKGLVKLLCSVVKHMYHATYRAPPRRAYAHLEKLVESDSALVM